MAGRPRKPTELKRLQGTYRPDREAKDEIKPPAVEDLPRAPAWMSTTGKRLYKNMAPTLQEKKLLTVLDMDLFMTACHEYGKYIEFEKLLKKKGSTYEVWDEDRNGNKYLKAVGQRPEVVISRNCLEAANKILSRFGFTPADRAKLSIVAEKEKEQSPLEQLLSMQRKLS